MANGNAPLGIGNQSKSSALGLQQLLGESGVLNNLAQAQQLGQRAQTLQAQESPSLLQRLLSPGGLALLAGTGIAAQQGGADAGIAFGGGALSGLQSLIAGEQEQKAEAVTQMQKQRDDALDRADKSMNRVNQLFNTNPDAFVDPETGENLVPPDLLGLLASGQAFPLNASSRRKLNRKDELQDARHDVLVSAVESAETVEDARLGFDQIFANQGWENPPPEVVDAVARSFGTPEFNTTLFDIVREHGGISGVQAAINAVMAGEGIENHLSIVNWKEQETDIVQPSQLETLKVLEMDQILNKFQKDEANRDFLRGLRSEAGTNQIEFMNGLLEEVFKGQDADITLYKTKRRILADNSQFGLYMKALGQSDAFTSLAEVLEGVKFQGTTEEIIRKKAELTNKLFNEFIQDINEAGAFDDAQSFDATSRMLRTQLNMSPQQASALAKQLLTDATDADGKLDESELRRLTELAVRQFQGEQ